MADADAVTIEPMTADDADAVLAIVAEGIATGVATFETAVPDWRRWNATHRKECRFVARDRDGGVVGWTALSSWSGRDVYAGVVWESVYVAAAARGRGVGRALLATLLPAAEATGIWTVMAGVQAENDASLALHEAERAFERFWRGDGARGAGSGLGLAIVRTIVERHGGTVRVTGSRFTLELPCEKPAESAHGSLKDAA